jgi:hypothetical protein
VLAADTQRHMSSSNINKEILHSSVDVRGRIC